jgi:hypothetical protein
MLKTIESSLLLISKPLALIVIQRSRRNKNKDFNISTWVEHNLNNKEETKINKFYLEPIATFIESQKLQLVN